MRKLALLLGLLAALLPFAAAASADQPQTATIPVSFSSVNTSWCGSTLPITTSGTGEIQITTFSDGRQIRHFDVDITLSANGKTLTNSQQNTVFVDGTTRTIVGAAWTITVSGQGPLLIDAGRLVLGPDGNPNQRLAGRVTTPAPHPRVMSLSAAGVPWGSESERDRECGRCRAHQHESQQRGTDRPSSHIPGARSSVPELSGSLCPVVSCWRALRTCFPPRSGFNERPM